jgi:hypothetical protein
MMWSGTISSGLTIPTLPSLVRLYILLETTELSQKALISLRMTPNLETLHVSTRLERFESAAETLIILPALKSLHMNARMPNFIAIFCESLEIPRLSKLIVGNDFNAIPPWSYQLADIHSAHLHSIPHLDFQHTFILRNRAIGNLRVLQLTDTEFDATFFETLLDLQLARPTLHKIVLESSYPSSCSAKCIIYMHQVAHHGGQWRTAAS